MAKAAEKKPQIKRAKAKKMDEEQLEQMLKTVTTRHRNLKKKLRNSTNNRTKDRLTIEYMLKQSIEMLELANSTFVTSGGRGLYSVVALNNNIRELMADLRSLEDNSGQIEFIMDSVIKPMLTIISQQNLNFVMTIKEEIIKKVKGAKAVQITDKMNDLLKVTSSLYDDCYEQAQGKVEEFLNG